MKIKTMVNFKLRNNAGLMLKGTYDDSEKPFPKEIYEEIERNKSGKRRTLVVLEDGKPKRAPAPVSTSKPMEMLDKSAEIRTVEPVSESESSEIEEKVEETKPEAEDSTESVETESDTTKKKKRATKKRTTTKSTTKKRAPKKKKTDE